MLSENRIDNLMEGLLKFSTVKVPFRCKEATSKESYLLQFGNQPERMKLAFDEYVPSVGLLEDLSPVIFLHGRLYSRKTWMKFAPEIAEKTKRKVYALDTRNHGESPWSDEMDFQVLADDVDEFLTDHKISKAILIGHSLGGRAAITLAIQKPEKVEKLIVEDMIVEDYSSKAKNSVRQILNLLRISLRAIPYGADEKTARKAVNEFIKSKLPPNTTKKGTLYDEISLPLRKDGDSYAWQANLDVLEDMLMNKTSNQSLSGVYNGDALFLYGNKSFFDVESDLSIPKYFPRAVKVCIEGAGHLIHHDYPEEFLKEVLEFI